MNLQQIVWASVWKQMVQVAPPPEPFSLSQPLALEPGSKEKRLEFPEEHTHVHLWKAIEIFILFFKSLVVLSGHASGCQLWHVVSPVFTVVWGIFSCGM